MSIVDFITARLAEDEQIARAAQQYTNATPWRFAPDPHGGHHWAGSIEDEPTPGVSANQIAEGVGESAWGEHIARHDPARALREVAAIRGVLESVEALNAALSGGEHHGLTSYTYGALEDLAAIWSDHPDYQEVLKPCQ